MIAILCVFVCVCVGRLVGNRHHHPITPLLVRRVPTFLSVTGPIVTNIRTHTHKTIFHEKIKKGSKKKGKKENPIRRFSDKRKRSHRPDKCSSTVYYDYYDMYKYKCDEIDQYGAHGKLHESTNERRRPIKRNEPTTTHV